MTGGAKWGAWDGSVKEEEIFNVKATREGNKTKKEMGMKGGGGGGGGQKGNKGEHEGGKNTEESW